MTPEERAERIYQGWCGIDTPPNKIHDRIVQEIAATIREAVEDSCGCTGYVQAYNQALEDAAQVAEKHMPDCDGGNCTWIADEIRALKEAK